MISRAIKRASISAKRSSTVLIFASFHQIVGASDGRGRSDHNQAQSADQNGDCLRAPAATAAREPASPRLLPVRAGWQRLKVTHDRLNDSLIGDAIGLAGVIGTFLIFYSLTA